MRGGYGTTGEGPVYALSFCDVRSRAGGRLANLDAFTAVGAFDLGSSRVPAREMLDH